MSVTKDITIDAGSRYSFTVTYQDSTGTAINISGWGARFMMRASQNPTSTAAITQLTVGSGITNSGTTGILTITLTAIQSAAMTILQGYYDLYVDPDVTASANSLRILQGQFRVIQNVAT